MKVEDNHYKYRIETKDSNGSVIDFVDIDTVEPLRCAYDVQDELNLETNEHIKRVEEIILNADSTEFWYVDEDRSTDTHLVCYFEEVQLMANADHPMVDTDRSLFEYGKINANEYQDTNFICTHVMPNGVSRIYMSIDKDQLLYQTYTNETIKEYIAQNPITVWYAIRYPVAIPRSMSKGHLLTLDGQTDVSISTNGKEVGLPLVKFNIGETEYNVDNKTLSIKNTTEGAQIRNIVLEGNTPINFARGNGVNTTEATSNTRYDFAPFYDGQTTISNTVEGGYVSAKLYGDTMVNIAKPYGETPLLTATNESALCDDLLGMNEEGIVLTDGEITEGRIYGDSLVNMLESCSYAEVQNGNVTLDGEYVKITSITDGYKVASVLVKLNTTTLKASTTYYIKYLHGQGEKISDQISNSLLRDKQNGFNYDYGVHYTWDYENHIFTLTPSQDTNCVTIYIRQPLNSKVRIDNCVYITDDLEKAKSYNIKDGFNGIGSVVNPTVYNVSENLFDYESFKAVEAVNGYVNIPIKLKPSTTYHIISDYREWNATGLFLYLAKQEANGSYTSLLSLIDQNQANTNGKSFSSSSYKANYVIRALSASRDGIIEKAEKIGIFEGVYNSHEITPHKHTEATLPYTLNKLPNGVADYIDVVNKVHVQRVGRVTFNGTETERTWIKGEMHTSNPQKDNLSRFYYGGGSGYNDLKTSSSMLSDKLPYANVTADRSEIESVGHMSNAYFNIVIRKDRLITDDVDGFKTWLQSNPITILHELATPIYTPLTDEEITQLPLSAYKDGYVMLSSDQLTPTFEFRMRASNRYQVDMLETGYYYLNAPVGNVKLGTANVDVQQMPCIVKVDNVGTGDSGYRLTTSATGGFNITIPESDMNVGGYFSSTDGAYVQNSNMCYSSIYYEISPNTTYGILSPMNMRIQLHTENQSFIKTIEQNNAYIYFTTTSDTKYFRISYHVNTKKDHTLIANPITLAKLPSHRIPTSFTQGMKCGTDFGYWEGVKESAWRGIRLSGESGDGSLRSADNGVRYLNRLEGNYQGVVIVEDEFDFAIGKLTKRIGKVILDGSVPIYDTKSIGEEYTYMTILGDKLGIKCRNSFSNGSYGFAMSSTVPFKVDYGGEFNHMFVGGNNLIIIIKNNELGVPTKEGIAKYFESNPMTVYYELAVPEISYVDVLSHHGKTVNNATALRTNYYLATTYLQPQIKPSHLTYPVPSLVGNRTYTVVHNRKNITGSTKPIILDLGGTQVELNNANGKTLVKTPSTLKHSSLIFIGGESTVDHVMVLDGDWTNKPIEYFENMMGHDTDAIITIIGNGQIDDVEEQYLW